MPLKENKMPFKEGSEFLITQGALIAMMPIQEWLDDLDHSESVAAILDPTLFRDYLYSPKPEALKEVLRAALGFKAAIQKLQEKAAADPVGFKDGMPEHYIQREHIKKYSNR